MRVVMGSAVLALAACSPTVAPSAAPVAHVAPTPAPPDDPPMRDYPEPAPAPLFGECKDVVAPPNLYIRPGFSPIVTRSMVNGTIVGDLDPRSIKRTVMARRFAFADCYRAHVASHPDDRARGLKLTFDLRADGSVHDLETEGYDPVLDRCVCAEIARLEFARPGGNTEVNVSYPFNFVEK